MMKSSLQNSQKGYVEMPEISFSFSCSLYEHHLRMSIFKLFHGLHFSYLEGGHRIIHDTVYFETSHLVACVACKRRAKFYLATLITRLVFTSFLSHYGSVSISLGQLVSLCISPLHCIDSCYFRPNNLYHYLVTY